MLGLLPARCGARALGLRDDRTHVELEHRAGPRAGPARVRCGARTLARARRTVRHRRRARAGCGCCRRCSRQASSTGCVDDAVVAASDAQRAALWEVRHSVSEGNKKAGVGLNTDSAVPVSAVPEFIERATAAVHRSLPGAADHRRRPPGRRQRPLHPVLQLRRMATRFADARRDRASHQHAVNDVAHALGGTFSAEHGVGRTLDAARWRTSSRRSSSTLMRGMKQLLDPDDLFNPGRLLPPSSDAAVTPIPRSPMKDDSSVRITSRRRILQARRRRSPRSAPPAVWSSRRAQSKRIVVRDDGGIYTKAYGAVFYKPFTEKTGIEVVGVQANAEPIAQIKSHGRHQELHLGHGQDQPARDPAAHRRRQGLPREARPRERPGRQDDPDAIHVALRRRHQRLHHRARLSHRRVQGPQGAELVGRLLEREGLPRPPRRCASTRSTRSRKR